MKKKSILLAIASLGLAGTSWADAESFSRISATALSGSGHSVASECGGNFEYANANIRYEIEDDQTEVKIRLKNARPHTLYTVWLRLKGNSAKADINGNITYQGFGGSPLTGGGATPMAATSHLATLIAHSPPNEGSATSANGFWTDANGNGQLKTELDFPLLNGAYPFHKLMDPTKNLFPVAIVHPDGVQIRAPFTLRIVSHCQDGLSHGLSPASREAWFNWAP